MSYYEETTFSFHKDKDKPAYYLSEEIVSSPHMKTYSLEENKRRERTGREKFECIHYFSRKARPPLWRNRTKVNSLGYIFGN